MKTLRSSNPRRLAFFAFLLLALSLSLIFFARHLIREVLVLPLSYLFWALGIFLDTTPQIVFWLSALAIAAMSAYRALVGRRKPVEMILPLTENGAQRPLNGQVAYWYLRVRLMRDNPSPYFINNFHQSVNRLLLDTLSHRFHLTSAQLEERLREGSLDVPPEVRDYALRGLRRVDPVVKPLLAALWESLSGAMRGLLREVEKAFTATQGRAEAGGAGQNRVMASKQAALPGEEAVQVVMLYIEKELEVKDVDPRR